MFISESRRSVAVSTPSTEHKLGVEGSCRVRLTKCLVFSLWLPDGLKYTSYTVTSPDSIEFIGLSQYRVREGWLVSKVCLRVRTGPGTKPVEQRQQKASQLDSDAIT